jgi:hypothetical protein
MTRPSRAISAIVAGSASPALRRAMCSETTLSITVTVRCADRRDARARGNVSPTRATASGNTMVSWTGRPRLAAIVRGGWAMNCAGLNPPPVP